MDKKFLVTGILIILILYIPAALLFSDYDDIVPQETKILVFVKNGCYGCEKMKPIVKELKNEGFDIHIITDLEIHKEHNVSVVPTTIVFGKETQRKIGYLSKKELVTFITEKKTY